MNKVILTGRIAIDLNLKDDKNKKRLFFTLAVDNGYGDKKTTQFIPIVVWEKLAENIKKYCIKGNKILIEGYLTSFKNKDNTDKIMITGYNVEFLANKNDDKKISGNKNLKDNINNKDYEFDAAIIYD